MNLELKDSGDLYFQYTFSSKLKPIKEVNLSLVDGVLNASAKIVDLINHIIEATPTKKDDKIFGMFGGFLDTGVKFLAFTKQVDEYTTVSLDNAGILKLRVVIPPHFSALKDVKVVLSEGEIDSNIDLLGLIEALVKQTPTEKDDALWDKVKGLVGFGLKFFKFKKKYPA